MSNETNLPVYSVPGTAGNPDLYYLRSFSSLPDTEITKEQFDGVTGDFEAASTQPADGTATLTEATLVDLHANQDPAANTPEAAGTPDQAAAAAANPVPVQPDPATDAQPAITTDGNPPADQAGTDPNATPVSGDTPSGSSSTGDGGEEAAKAQTEEVPAASSGAIEASQVPGAGSQTEQSAGTTEGPVSDAEPTTGSGTSEQNVAAATAGNTDQVAATINNLPGDVSPEGVVTDPTTGTPVDLTDHAPAVADANPDSESAGTTLIAPPSSVAPEDHASWWAKEKQRLINWLRAEADKLEAGVQSDEAAVLADLHGETNATESDVQAEDTTPPPIV